jgi:hypothetical protein
MEEQNRQNRCQSYGLNQANRVLVNVLDQIQGYQTSLGIHCPYATLVYDENYKRKFQFMNFADKPKKYFLTP